VLNSVNTKHTRRLLRNLYHRKGPGRKPYNPLAMLKAQLLKHLLRIPSDRRLALRLRHDRRTARACGFKKQTPSHGLFTHFRHRLGEETYHRIFNQLLRRLLEDGAVKGDVIAVDSTHVDAYSQRAPDNRTGKSDPEARVGSPCNENDKVYFKPLLESVHALGIEFKTVLADAQYNSAKVRAAAEAYGAEPVIPVRRDSRVKDALKVGRDFVTRGAQRLVELFKGRWSVERLFGRAKEWLLLGCLRLRGLEQAAIHACLSFTAMLAVAHAAVRCREPGLMRSIKHFTA
jgi:transposase